MAYSVPYFFKITSEGVGDSMYGHAVKLVGSLYTCRSVRVVSVSVVSVGMSVYVRVMCSTVHSIDTCFVRMAESGFLCVGVHDVFLCTCCISTHLCIAVRSFLRS